MALILSLKYIFVLVSGNRAASGCGGGDDENTDTVGNSIPAILLHWALQSPRYHPR